MELAILIIFGGLPLATGLKCYDCTHFESTLTDTLEDPVCRDGDTTKLISKECGSACAKFEGEYSGSVGSAQATGKAIIRACLDDNDLSQPGIDASSTKCQSVKDASYLGAKFGITLNKAEGTICVCATDNCNGQSMAAPAIYSFVISLVMVIFVSL